jgi:putative YhbY family RNA-binding protein
MTSDNSLAPARRTIPELSGADRKSLRAEAHHLDPVVAIGDAGLTPSVLAEADRALSAHGLIKIRVHGDDRERRIAIMEQLRDGLGCAPVQMIGKLLVVWREKPETGTGGNAGTARRRAPRQTKKAVGAGQKKPVARKKPAPRQAEAGAARAAGAGRPSEPVKRSVVAVKPVSRARPATAGASPSRKTPGAKAGSAARAGLTARPARPSKRPPAAKPSAGGARSPTRSARPGPGTRVRRRVP